MISAETKAEHDKILNVVLEINNTVKFSEEKFQYCLTVVKYLGYLVGNSEIKLAKHSIESIAELLII